MNQIWFGRMQIMAKGKDCVINLVEPNGDVFASCPQKYGGTETVEKVTDSTRYFVLRIEQPGTGKHGYIGIGFQTRDDAYDFKVALQDHGKQIKVRCEDYMEPGDPRKCSQSLGLGLSVSISPPLSLPLSLPLSVSPSLSLSLCVSLCFSVSVSLSHTHILSLSLTLIPTHAHFPSVSHTDTHKHTHTHTHTHTLTLTHTCTH